MDAKKIVGAIISMLFRLAIAIFVLYFIYEATLYAYNFGYRIFADRPCALEPGQDIEVTVTEGMSDKERAKKFEEVGLVADWKLFWVQTILSEYKDDLQPGTYKLNNSMRSGELLAAMASIPKDGDEELEDGSKIEQNSNVAGEPVDNTDDVEVPDGPVDNADEEVEETDGEATE